MTRPKSDLDRVRALIAAGNNDCEVSRATGIPRGTIRDWRKNKGAARPRQLLLSLGSLQRHPEDRSQTPCPRCDLVAIDENAYAYLLGMYLGDGCLTPFPREVFKLRIACDFAYPGIVSEWLRAIDAIKTDGAAANTVAGSGCVELYSMWKHWVCLFPQHGPGPKHLRRITLAEWQEQIADRYPDRLLRGLVHSDGCRYANTVNGTAYWSYAFSNNSQDIQAIFTAACDRLGIRWRRASWKMISITRRRDVEKLDLFIGPKA
ncbi:MAG: hypothetical protein M3290_13760 [Actinomycetota bacterium]|nr:hypothetical protein [Actinomycetota bacterium]